MAKGQGITPEQRQEILERHAAGEFNGQIARDLGLSTDPIRRAIRQEKRRKEMEAEQAAKIGPGQ